MLTIALDDARNIVEIMPNPILVIAPDLRVQTANRAFCRMFQVELSETEGKLLPELCDGAWDLPSLLEKLEAILRTGSGFSDFEIEQDYPGAGHKHLVVRATVAGLAGAGTKTALLAIEDLTTRQALLARETEARRDAEKANQIKDEFLATLSHELRTPLTAILSWAQILRLKDGADAAHTRKAVALIEKSGKDLGQLIEDLLDISSIQAGKVRLELREIDPLECIAAALDSVRTQADDKSIAIQTEFEPPSCRIQADSARLQQVFGNLLTNAVKFTPAGGTVTVRTKRQTTQLEIQVQDTGKGITPEFLPYVFKRFSQEDSSPKRAFGGLGLGLSIARSLAGLHGGTVTADSPGEGKGAVFTVTLPCGAACLPHEACATSESDQITTLRSERPARLTGLRVLVIDDQPVAREVVSALLEPLGAQVQSAGNAREGLAILASDRPDIVLCDLSMPGEDGFDVIREARALDPGEGGTVPIVALTAYAEGETVRRCIDAGFAAHMAKPMDAVDLARLITRLVERPTPAS